MVSTPWGERHWPDLGIRALLPPCLHPFPFREGDRRGLVLAGARDDPREFLALTRQPVAAASDGADAWRGEAARLTGTPGWEGAVVVSPYPMALDGVRGRQGWLRFREPGGAELAGLLWVGRVGDDRVTVAYWGEGYQAPAFAARYRRLLDGVRWTAVAAEG